jgi:hypothetical protein
MPKLRAKGAPPPGVAWKVSPDCVSSNLVDGAAIDADTGITMGVAADVPETVSAQV